MELTDENIRTRFSGADDFVSRQLNCCGYTIYIYNIDGLVAVKDISAYVVRPITEHLRGESMIDLYQNALTGMIYNAVAKPINTLEDAAGILVNGFCLVLFPDVGALAFETKTPATRSISEPEMENTPKGAKDGFVETIRTNTSLVRRHLRTPDLRLSERTVGKKSLTNVAVIWIQGVTDPKYPERMLHRLDRIETDGLILPASVEETVTGSRFTAFPLLQYTQRTDRFCKGLLEGRVGLLVDGIPLGYLAPVDLGYLMDSTEDYSRDFITASAIRVLRYLSVLIDLLLPALYIAFTVNAPDLLPESLQQIISTGRQNVPFSPVWEILTLLLAFELLQESGVHLPQAIGQSVSIIGGIVVGTVGVEAGLISSPALITVSLAGVCGFVLPNRDLADAIRICRFALAILAATGGFAGIVLGFGVVLVRLWTLKSLGQRYLRIGDVGVLRDRSKGKYRAAKKDEKWENSC